MNDRGERSDPAAAGRSSAPGPLAKPNVYGRLARGSARRPWLVILIYVALAAAGLAVAVLRLDVDTNPARMIAGDIEFRQDFDEFSEAFPALDSNFVVTVEAEDGELARDTARALAAAFEARPDQFTSVHAPGTGEFFDEHGVLYLDLERIQGIAAQLNQSLPTIQALADDPTLRGMSRMVADIRLGVEFGQAPPEIAGFFTAGADTVESVIAGEPEPLDWTTLGFDTAPLAQQRWYVLVGPRLDYTQLEPAEASLTAARQIVAEERARRGDVRVALTGEAAMNAEELRTVTEGAAFAGLVSLVLVSLVILLGFPAARFVVPALVMLVLGILMTAGFATVTVGYLNLISVAFAVLFIGLGVDYAVHVILRYNEEAKHTASKVDALTRSGHHIGPPLTAILLTTVLAFLAFTPTDFIGMAQLGVIASGGVVIAFIASLTLIPALLTLLRKPGAGTPGLMTSETMGAPKIMRWLSIVRAASTGAVLVLAGLAVFALPEVRFDGDPVNLKDPSSRAVVEFERILAEDPGQVYAAQVLSEPGEPARDRVAALENLPEVAHVNTVEDFVPANQDEKIATLRALQDQVPEQVDFERPIEPADRRAAMERLKEDLGAIADFENAPQDIAAAASRWQEALIQFDTPEPASSERLGQLQRAFFAELPILLQQLRQITSVEPVTLENLAPDVSNLYVASDGRWRLEVVPSEDMNEEANLEQFATAVRSVAPHATGAPIEIVGAANVVSRAMLIATALALGLVTAVLIPVLRRLIDVALVLAPLVLAGLLLVGYTVIAGTPFNFANVIVLPLLIGLGADSSIHYVMRAREQGGRHEIAETSTPRAVLLSALTTIASFGTLWLSTHRGVSSMGEHLTVAIVITLVCTLLVLPQLIRWTIGRKAHP